MVETLMVLGAVVEAAAWWWISSRRASVWATMTPMLVGLGALALASGVPRAAEDVSPDLAAAVGLASGLALFAATRVFVAIAAPRWRAFREQSVSMYGRRGQHPLWSVLGLSIVLMVPGEELFWRGLLLPEIQDAVGSAVLGALVAWVAFALANLPSRNLAIIAGSTVGGAAWVALASWSGGMLASLLCHGVWTALMLWLPPLPTGAGPDR